MTDDAATTPLDGRRPAQAHEPDAHLVERTIDTTTVYRGHFLHVRQARVRLPDDSEAWREFIVHPGAVVMVPMLDDGRLVIERQYRYPMGRVMTEFPAGKLSGNEPPIECAVRELAEETGYTAREWARAGVLHNAIAYSDEFIEVWFARGLQGGVRHLDEGEFLDVGTASADELDAMAARGELTDAKSLVALMWLQNWRAGRWPVQWRPAG